MRVEVFALGIIGAYFTRASGAYVHAAIGLARSGTYRTVVTTLNDSGERYGSTGMWQQQAERQEPRAAARGG
jgi:hypothetical protein